MTQTSKPSHQQVRDWMQLRQVLRTPPGTARTGAPGAGLGADSGRAGIDTKDEAMSTMNETEIEPQDWSRADRIVAGLMLTAALGFLAGAVATLWI